jgi:hypothetical protein
MQGSHRISRRKSITAGTYRGDSRGKRKRESAETAPGSCQRTHNENGNRLWQPLRHHK